MSVSPADGEKDIDAMGGIATRQTTPITIGKAAVLFVDHCRVAKALSTHTLRAYGSDLADFAHFTGHRVLATTIDRVAIRAYGRMLLDDRQLKATTVKRRIATMKVFFQWMEREEHVPLSIFHRLAFSIRIPRQLPRALRRQEIRDLLLAAQAAATNERPSYDSVLMHFVLVTLYMTGLKVGELVSARRADLAPEEGSLRVRGKGNRERRVYLSGASARNVISTYLATQKAPTVDGFLLTITCVRAHHRRG